MFETIRRFVELVTDKYRFDHSLLGLPLLTVLTVSAFFAHFLHFLFSSQRVTQQTSFCLQSFWCSAPAHKTCFCVFLCLCLCVCRIRVTLFLLPWQGRQGKKVHPRWRKYGRMELQLLEDVGWGGTVRRASRFILTCFASSSYCVPFFCSQMMWLWYTCDCVVCMCLIFVTYISCDDIVLNWNEMYWIEYVCRRK